MEAFNPEHDSDAKVENMTGQLCKTVIVVIMYGLRCFFSFETLVIYISVLLLLTDFPCFKLNSSKNS